MKRQTILSIAFSVFAVNAFAATSASSLKALLFNPSSLKAARIV
ncbi:hypothetical protein [Pseudomonas sp. Root562]